MTNENGDNETDRTIRRAMRIEDALILLALVPLFVLGVFYRDTAWGQVGLCSVFVVMLVVFIIRLRRANKAFREGEDG